MISFDESQKILKQIARAYKVDQCEDIDLAEAVDRVLAEDLFARENNPPFDNSAMDGFAVNTKEVCEIFERGECKIPVQAVLGAGDNQTDFNIKNGALQIMTGAPIPNSNYDSVIRVEDAEVYSDERSQMYFSIHSKPRLGENIRRAGEDSMRGDCLLHAGTLIKGQHLLALASQGIAKLKVKSQLGIAILSTGKEIVDYHESDLNHGQIRNSTGIYLQATLKSPAYRIKDYGIIADEAESYLEQLKKTFKEGVDVIISTGAVSMGVFDFVRPALESLGAEIHFHKCAIRPGKPILFATLIYDGKARFIFGVPGNPVSTLVGCHFFVQPFLQCLLGLEVKPPIKATLINDVKTPTGFKTFLKAKLHFEDGEAFVESLKGQASFMVSPLLNSNALAILSEEESFYKQGTKIEVYQL